MPPTIPGAERRRLLARCRPFPGLPAPDLDLLAARAPERRYAHGRPIFARGEPGSCMFAIAEGQVRLSVTSAEGREVLLAVLGPGEVFGELALLTDLPRTATVRALEPTELLGLTAWNFRAELQQSPEVAYQLLRVTAQRLAAADAQLAER